MFVVLFQGSASTVFVYIYCDISWDVQWLRRLFFGLLLQMPGYDPVSPRVIGGEKKSSPGTRVPEIQVSWNITSCLPDPEENGITTHGNVCNYLPLGTL